jgi:hypothetical protein
VNRRISPHAREILRAARVCELRRLADDTARTFVDAQRCTNLPAVEIAAQMLNRIDAARTDDERQAASAPAVEVKRRQARPVLVLPTNAHSRKALVRCLVRRGSP